MTSFQIAIDGPVAAGKGTISKILAKRLNYLYVDTGAMYRVAALLAKQQGIDWANELKIAALISQSTIDMHNPTSTEQDGRQTTVIVNGVDVSWAIRTEEMGIGASTVAKLAAVRQVLVAKQQQIAVVQNVIMEGRDITFKVLPQSPLKIYLTANINTRAKRRYQELLARGEDVNFDHILLDLKKRDQQDMGRSVDPLHIVKDAWVLDTTNLTIEAVVDLIEQKVNSLTNPFISYNDFAKIDIRIGTVVEAVIPPDSDKVIKLTVSFGSLGNKTIFSGLKKHFQPADIIHHQFPFILNLTPKKMSNLGESQGMIMAAVIPKSKQDKTIVLLTPQLPVPDGTKVM